MDKYTAASRLVRAHFDRLTPLVEPLSLDEAFLDLNGTERLHGAPPARMLADLCLAVENEIGITVSVGLSYNKSLAKLASEIDKPRGFAVVGRAEARAFLAGRPVGDIWGVGAKLQARLRADGITRIGQLADRDEVRLMKRYGSIAQRLVKFAQGQDDRPVRPDRERKSISAETTFDSDIAALRDPGRPPLAAQRAGRRCLPAQAGHRPHRGAETEDGGFPDPEPQPHPVRADRVGRRDPRSRPRHARATLRRPQLSPDRHRHQQPAGRRGAAGGGLLLDPLLSPKRRDRVQLEAAMSQVRDRFGADAIDRGLAWNDPRRRR